MIDAFDDDRGSAWLDGELSETEHAEFAARLASDPSYRTALDELEATRSLLRAQPAVEPPAEFLAGWQRGDADEPSTAVVVDLSTRRRRRATATFAGVAAAAALLVAVMVPSVNRAQPALAADIQTHQAGVAASGDPVSGLAPLGAPTGLGR